MVQCQYCGKEFKNIFGKNGHVPYCKCNPNKLSAWNKGLTKETDARIAKYTESMVATKNDAEYYSPAWNKGLTKETDARVAKYTESMVATKNSQIWKDITSSRIYEKYGGMHFTQTSAYKAHARDCLFLKYGVYSVMHVPEICKKILEAAYRFKPYTMPSGNIVYTQGYENFALDHILQIYPEQDIEVSFGITQEFYYTLEKEVHRYYPDILIKSENKIIEVKSTYTVTHNKQKNIEKEQCVLDKGLLFEVWVFDRDGTIIEKIIDFKKYLTER